MKINIFAVADSVSVYEQGKLVIVGTFDNIQADKCPLVFRPFGVALKISAEPRDYGKKYDGRVVLRKFRTSKPIAEIPFPLNFPKQSAGKRIGAVFAANMSGVKFDSFGAYVLEFRVGSKVVSEIDLKVVKAKPSKAKAKTKKNK